MRERGILFSAPMVRALLDGRKTQTRRIVKPQPERRGTCGPSLHGVPAWYWTSPRYDNGDGVKYFHTDEEAAKRLMVKACPYGVPGDRLWVREAWTADFGPTFSDNPDAWWHEMPRSLRTEKAVAMLYFAADKSVYHPTMERDFDEKFGSEARISSWEPEEDDLEGLRWQSPRFMPRWASRLTLTLTDVRVQRVQEINDAQIVAEGITDLDGVPVRDPHDMTPAQARHVRAEFRGLWDSLNAKRGGSWKANPWVWALTFERVA